MADSIEVGMTVSTADGPDLDLSEDGAYGVVIVGPGGQTWRRRTVESDYQHGRKALTESLDSNLLSFIVRVYGDDWVDVRGRAATMFEAFSQHVYTVTTIIEGVTDIYVCEPADIQIVGGDVWQKEHLYAHMQEYQIAAPYNLQEVITS